LAADSLQQTQVSEVTRQVWVLMSLVLIECVALAGVSAALNMNRAPRNLWMCVLLFVLGTVLTVAAIRIVTQWGGYVALTLWDYVRIIGYTGGYGAILAVILVLPTSRAYGRAIRRRSQGAGVGSWAVHPTRCGILYVVAAGVCGVAALLGSFLSLPFWYLIRWVLVGWSAAAILLGLAVCLGWTSLILDAYVLCLVGVALHLICWGMPFALTGPPVVLKILLGLVALHLVVLGRVRDCLEARPPVAVGG